MHCRCVEAGIQIRMEQEMEPSADKHMSIPIRIQPTIGTALIGHEKMRILISLALAIVSAFSVFGQITPTVHVKTMADLLSIDPPSVNNRLSSILCGYSTTNDGLGGLLFYNTNSTSST